MSSRTVETAPDGSRGSRAFEPGSRRAIGGATLVVVALAVTLVLVLRPGGSKVGRRLYGNEENVTTYGKIPKWIPKIPTTPVNPKPDLASVRRPVLHQEQGFPVQAVLPSGTADITLEGPAFPQYVVKYATSDRWPTNKPAPASFNVTVTGVRGTVPLKASAFSVLNEAGTVTFPSVTVKGGGALPAVVHAGQQLRVTLHANLTTEEGEGSVRWAPLSSKVLVGWMYQVELD